MSDAPAIEAEGLLKRYGDVGALDGVDLRVARDRLRPARPERGGQDDRRAHPHDAASRRPRERAGRGNRRRQGGRAPPPADRPRRPVRRGRREPDRLREPRDGRAALPPAAGGRASARARAARDVRPHGRGGPPRPHVLGRDAAAARPRRGAGRAAAGASSSTSRRPGSTRAAGSASGRRSRALVADGTTVLLTTQYLDEADRLADRISVIDHGLVIAEGTPSELKGPGRRRAARGPPRATPSRREAAIAALAASRRARRRSRSRVLRVPVRSATGRSPTRCAARRRRGGIDDIVVRAPTLDDVFLTLTGHAAEDDEEARTMSGSRTPLSDTLVLAKRNFLRIPRAARPAARLHRAADHVRAALRLRLRRRDPTPGHDYVDFLIPGSSSRRWPSAASSPRSGLAEDLKKGLIDRFRSLPMSRSAVLTGRTLADVATNVVISS